MNAIKHRRQPRVRHELRVPHQVQPRYLRKDRGLASPGSRRSTRSPQRPPRVRHRRDSPSTPSSCGRPSAPPPAPWSSVASSPSSSARVTGAPQGIGKAAPGSRMTFRRQPWLRPQERPVTLIPIKLSVNAASSSRARSPEPASARGPGRPRPCPGQARQQHERQVFPADGAQGVKPVNIPRPPPRRRRSRCRRGGRANLVRRVQPRRYGHVSEMSTRTWDCRTARNRSPHVASP